MKIPFLQQIAAKQELLKRRSFGLEENTKIRAALESNDFVSSLKTMALARINSNPEDPQAYYIFGKKPNGVWVSC
jgi:hypothetical protein